jgi:hypothetical protein
MSSSEKKKVEVEKKRRGKRKKERKKGRKHKSFRSTRSGFPILSRNFSNTRPVSEKAKEKNALSR